MSTHGLDPDALLGAVQREQQRAAQGRLKLFLGMAPGVGKTYAMLQAAQARHREGIDVVMGYVESHGRAETDALTTGLPQIPCLVCHYRGTALTEMDLDAILARKPQLVLVDELAHSNAPGSRHPKRWQDVIELLEAGIDVYTTVNVQHMESRADSVQQMTGAPVQERVPDSLLDLAAEVALIDLAPEALLNRLAEGKIYLGDRAQRAAQGFFQPVNLIALREMALRLTAERVDQELQDYLDQQRPGMPWKATERLLVGVSPSPSSEQLIRWTRRMAYSLSANWMVVYIDTGHLRSEADQGRLTRHLELARELGAEVMTTQGDAFMPTLLRVARQNHITQILIGKPQQSMLRDFFSGALFAFHRLVRQSGPIDLWIIDSSRGQVTPRPLTIPDWLRDTSAWYQVILTLAVTTILCIPLRDLAGYWSVALIYLTVVMGLSLTLPRGAVLLAAALSGLLWNFFFIPPLYTFHIRALHDLLMCGVYFAVSLTMGGLTARLRAQEQAGRIREERTHALYRFSQRLAAAEDLAALVHTSRADLEALFQAPISLMLGPPDDFKSTHPLDAKELSVAKWAYQTQQPTGRFTDTLPLATGHYQPLRGRDGVTGVLGLHLPPERELGFEQRQFLETLTRLLGVALERELLRQQAAQAALRLRSEELHTALFNSVSHELRTPLTTIGGAIANLRNEGLAPELQTTLLEDIDAAAQRLNRLVANLLDMSRLQAGQLQPHQDWCDLGDILREALHQLERELRPYPVALQLPTDLPPIRADFGLLEQVFVNLLHNVVVHNPPGTAVELAVRTASEQLTIAIADTGQGLPPEAIPRLFDTFYRGPEARTGGTGLGLSIAQGFVAAHGGTLTAANRPNGGSCFTVTLPMTPLPRIPEEDEE